MQISIVLSPTLNVTAQEFTDAWNRAPESQTLAQATAGTPKAVGFPLDPQWQQTLIFLGGLAGGVALDIVKDVVKKIITDSVQKQLDAHVKPALMIVDAVPQPDGAVLLVVREEGKL